MRIYANQTDRFVLKRSVEVCYTFKKQALQIRGFFNYRNRIMKVRNIVLVCVALITVGLPKFAFGEMEYFALFMAGKKVGHAIQSRVEANGRVTTTEKVAITISRADIAVTTTTSETSIETTDGKPLGFEMEQDLSIMTMKITGTINEQGMVDMTIASMGVE